jgi:hypothetical protein
MKNLKLDQILGSRIIMIAVIAILIMLLFKQCNETNSAKEEAKREHNNYLASQDSVRKIKTDLDKSIYEKSSYVLKISELSEAQKDLIDQLELSKNGRKTTPKTVIQYVTQYRDTGRVITSSVKGKEGVDTLTFKYQPVMAGKNKFVIDGKTPYSLSLVRDVLDTTKYNPSILSYPTELIVEQNIDIVTGIYRDPKSKRIMTRVSTEFPKLSFSEINSFDITDNPETREVLKKARREFGFGLSVGYGIVQNPNGIRTGIFVGVGLNYSPRWLQFGK